MNKNQVRLLAGCFCFALALAATPDASNAQEDLSAAFVYVGPVGDAGWTYRHDQGRQCLEQKTGIKTAYVESVPETPDVGNVERDFLAQGYDLIFATAFGYQPFTQEVAKENPEQHFFGITPTVAPADNILNYYGELWDGRYLTGLVAGSMTKSNAIGFVAAQPIPTVIAGLNAFTLGVREVNPEAEVRVIWTLSWFDPPAEKQAAVALVEAGADVIAQHQDTPSSVQGAAEKGVWAIGSESDMTAFAPDKYLTGTVWNWCPFYFQAVEMVENGTFEPGEFYGGLKDGTVSLAPINAAVPDDVRQMVETRKQALIDGTFDYWQGPLKDNQGNEVVAAGKTLSVADINGMGWLVEGVVGKIPELLDEGAQAALAGPTPGHTRGPVPLVRLEGVTKRFGPLLANDDVSLDIPTGLVLGLLGENGAGKTTAMNVLAGLYLPERGRVLIDGEPLPLGSPRASVAAGIGMVHQQFKLVETLTGFENISLGLHRGRMLQPAGSDDRIRARMAEVGFEIDLAARVWQMSLAERQQLELLRTLAVGARVLILDEPTSVLSPLETGRLFAIIRRIAASGRAVVVISHKLLEVLEVADRLVVMRAGRVVRQGPAGGVDPAGLARLIVGEREIRHGARPPGPFGDLVLRVQDLAVDNDLDLAAVRSASVTVRAGELVAIVGVTGNGQTELMDAIGGLRRHTRGHIHAPGHPGGRSFAYIPAQHLGVALAPDLPLADNAILGHQRRPPFGWWLRRHLLRERAREVAARFAVTADPAAPVRRLSGGNLQRVVLGRELHGDPALIVASYPTRGLDVAAAAQIRDALVARARAGAAVLISSEELDESLEIANRILVMHRGRNVAERDPTRLDVAELGRLVTTGGA